MPDAADGEANRRRVADIYAAYASGNRAAALDALADDVIWISHGGAEVPWGGTWRGRAEVGAYFERLDAVVAITAFEVERLIADGDWVVALAHGTGRFHATGETMTLVKADAMRLVDGKVAEFREYYDAAPLAGCIARCGGLPG